MGGSTTEETGGSVKGRLSGQVVATTRETDQNDPLTRALRAEGAEVRVWPTLAFLEPEDHEPLNRALERLDAFGWMAFTSPRAVASVAVSRAWREGYGRVAAVGEATATALRGCGWPVHLTGEGDGGAGLARAMAAACNLRDVSVLFLAGSMARPELERALASEGAHVHRVEAYRTEVTPPDGARVRADLARGVAAVLFASPSAVRGVCDALDGGLAAALADVAAVAIGTTTAGALQDAGVARVAVADESSMEGLVEACVKALNSD